MLCLSTDAAQEMHSQLLTLKRPGRKSKKEKAVASASRLPQNCPWALHAHSVLATALQDKIERRLMNEATCAEGVGQASPPPASFMLQCPRPTCRLKREAAKATLVKGTAWTQLKCLNCMRSSSASKWLCPCGIPWHTCRDHRGPGFTCGSKPHFRKAPRVRTAKETIAAELGSPSAAPHIVAGLRPPTPRRKVAAKKRASHTRHVHASFSSCSRVLQITSGNVSSS